MCTTPYPILGPPDWPLCSWDACILWSSRNKPGIDIQRVLLLAWKSLNTVGFWNGFLRKSCAYCIAQLWYWRCMFSGWPQQGRTEKLGWKGMQLRRRWISCRKRFVTILSRQQYFCSSSLLPKSFKRMTRSEIDGRYYDLDPSIPWHPLSTLYPHHINAPVIILHSGRLITALNDALRKVFTSIEYCVKSHVLAMHTWFVGGAQRTKFQEESWAVARVYWLAEA